MNIKKIRIFGIDFCGCEADPFAFLYCQGFLGLRLLCGQAGFKDTPRKKHRCIKRAIDFRGVYRQKPITRENPESLDLLDFHLCTCLFQLGFQSFGFIFGNAFLDGLRCGIHQFLGFLEAQGGKFLHQFDHCQFRLAG